MNSILQPSTPPIKIWRKNQNTFEKEREENPSKNTTKTLTSLLWICEEVKLIASLEASNNLQRNMKKK
jgi:hypothetical protein